MAGSNKRPLYYDAQDESAFYENTPKHVIYALARDLASQQFGGDLNIADTRARTLSSLTNLIDTLKANDLIP